MIKNKRIYIMSWNYDLSFPLKMGLYFNENSWISAGLQWPYSPEIIRAGPSYDNGPIQVIFSENHLRSESNFSQRKVTSQVGCFTRIVKKFVSPDWPENIGSTTYGSTTCQKFRPVCFLKKKLWPLEKLLKTDKIGSFQSVFCP